MTNIIIFKEVSLSHLYEYVYGSFAPPTIVRFSNAPLYNIVVRSGYYQGVYYGGMAELKRIGFAKVNGRFCKIFLILIGKREGNKGNRVEYSYLNLTRRSAA